MPPYPPALTDCRGVRRASTGLDAGSETTLPERPAGPSLCSFLFPRFPSVPARRQVEATAPTWMELPRLTGVEVRTRPAAFHRSSKLRFCPLGKVFVLREARCSG